MDRLRARGSGLAPPVTPGDMAMGAALVGTRLAYRGLLLAGRMSAPVVRVAVDPPFVPWRWRPKQVLLGWGRDWQEHREVMVRTMVEGAAGAVAAVADLVLPLVDLTAVVQRVLERLDLDALAAQAVDGLDLETVVEHVLDELDVGDVVDLALRDVDLTELVVDHVDLGLVVGMALDDVDLTAIVLTQTDLRTIVVAALDTLDLTAMVRERVDVAGIAEDVIQAIDLPAIIQESTGSVASEAVRSARLASVDADDAIARVADRLLFRVRGRRAASGAPLEGQVADENDRTVEGSDGERA